MKKVILLFSLMMVFLFTGVVFAADPYDPLRDLLTNYGNHVNDDGIVTSFNLNDNFTNLSGINRSSWYSDVNGQNPQNTAVTVRAEAFIPCYIEMKVTGNKGQTIVQSYGPGASANRGPDANYWLNFDNEIGGFVDENWNSIGHGKNAEIQPAPGVYIQGCDVFKVEVYANDTYKYQVESGALTNVNADISSVNANDTLELQMRTSIDNNPWLAAVNSFSSNPIAVIVPSRAACDSLVALHQFRVPYNKNTAHGKYEGNVIFRAVTI